MKLTASQIIATRPEVSARVMANAGAGKTFVLTTRVLRLLLKGVAPSKILCLTYTKAAAAEMNERVNSRLQRWALMDDGALRKELSDLIEVNPSDEQLKIAKTLFSTTLESMPPPRIQTIHSFCQEVLKRFPLESGVQPYFEVIDDITAGDLLKETKLRILSAGVTPEVRGAVDFIARESGEWKFDEIVNEIIGQRNRIRDLFANYESPNELIEFLFTKENVSQRDSAENIINQFMDFSLEKIERLYSLAEVLGNSDMKTDQKNYQALSENILQKNFAAYQNVFLTQNFTARAPQSVITKKALENFTYGWPWIEREQQELLQLHEDINVLENLEYTAHVIHLADGLITVYEALKHAESVLDYEDLIFYTRNLLTSVEATSWVLYKLDGGVEHILIDEAQDTSPEQWQIVTALVDEFLSGEGASTRDRTVFVVGDEKQSIYSFQGADQKAFAEVTNYIRERSVAAGKSFMDIDLKTSFRSIQSILTLVDTAFVEDEYRSSITSADAVSHELNRMGEGGKVEVWPLMKNEDEVSLENWQLPLEFHSTRTSEWLLAEKIADTIASWINSGRTLISTGEKIRPSDILILLKSRGEMADILIRKLKRRNIPVAGSDRLKVTSHIAVKDLIALANFLLLPSDDLSLAALLKSPLFGITEEDLFTLCYKRESTIWARITSENKYDSLFQQLNILMNKADYISIYQLYSFVLDQQGGRKKFISRLGHEVNDVLDEFLDLALNFEIGHTNSLQQFIHWISNAEMEIKRDMESSGDQVRIMTVHGAKGLEAPIVILADAAKLPQTKEQLIWDDGAFYGYKTKDRLCKKLRLAHENAVKADYDEYLRLLYVAITRARDELYITGALGERKLNIQKSWYNVVSKAIGKIGEVNSDTGHIVHDTKQINQVDYRVNKAASQKHELPEFLKRKLPTISLLNN